MEDDKKYWDDITHELENKYPNISKYLKSSYSHLLKETFYKVFDTNDLKHILWVIRMDNDISNETIKTIQKLFSSKMTKLKADKTNSVPAVPTPKNIGAKLMAKNTKDSFSRIGGATKHKVGLNRFILAWVVVLGFYLLTYFLLIKPIPENVNQVVFMLFGTIATGYGTVLGFFFGSSQSSGEKDELIHQKFNKES